MDQRVWNDLILETRYEFGSAARGNRGRYSGTKVHALRCEYIVGIVEGKQARPGMLGARFAKTGKPELFSAWPLCHCTQGQQAGAPMPGLTEADVTCANCRPAAKAAA